MNSTLKAGHVAILIFMIEIDTTVFSLPRIAAENFGTNGWIGILLLSGFAAANIGLYALLYRAAEGRSVYEIAEAVIPKGVLMPVYVVLALFWTFVGSLIGKNFVMISQMLSFQSTNTMIIFFLYCILVYALLSKSLASILRATTVFFVLTFWLNVLIPYYFKQWSLIRLTTSVFQGTDHGITLHGMGKAFTVFVGYELIMFLFPDAGPKSKLFRGVYFGHALITLNYVAIILISFGFFSFQEVKELEFPLISTLEYLELPFVNRLENLVFMFFLYSNIVSTVMFGYAALTALRRMLPKAGTSHLAGGIAALTFGFGFFMSTLLDSEDFLDRVFMTEAAIAVILPLILLPLAYAAKRKASGRGQPGMEKEAREA